jgi:ClpP class serine protease
MDLSNGLALFVSSPGGDGIAATRIINICRNYSGTDEYWAVVPSRAKSAATLICMGASEIIMSASSELGPVDPQWVETDEKGRPNRYSIYDIVSSYEKLFSDAVSENKGNLEPYLQQLKEYHPWDIAKFKKLCSLSKDIAVKALKTGMMKDLEEDEIIKNIGIFLTTKETKVHERPIFVK